MSPFNGVIRFFLFLAIVGLGLTGYYASTLKNSINKNEITITTLTAERDSWKSKYDKMEKDASESAAALKQAQDKAADLQAKVDAAAAPPKEHRRK